jgi:hypothetical protein
MRSAVQGRAHFKSSPPTSRICSFKQRNSQTSNNPALGTMTLPTILPKLIAFDLVRTSPFSCSIFRFIYFSPLDGIINPMVE